LPDPEKSRQFYASRRNRQRHCNNQVISSCIEKLQDWAEEQSSSVISLCGSFQTRHHTRDLAVDIIGEVAAHNMPVAWALQSRDAPSSDYTTADVLKQIISQLLQHNHTMLNERSAALSAARFHSATTEKQFFGLLGSVLEGLNSVYIVIDVEVLVSALETESSWSEAFTILFEGLEQRNIKTNVKVAFVSFRANRRDHISGCDERHRIDLPRIKSGRIEKISFHRRRKTKHRQMSKMFPGEE
jgi:hypothetical protein